MAITEGRKNHNPAVDHSNPTVWTRDVLVLPQGLGLEPSTMRLIAEAETCLPLMKAWSRRDFKHWVPADGSPFWAATNHPLCFATDHAPWPNWGAWAPHTLVEADMVSRLGGHGGIRVGGGVAEFKSRLLLACHSATGISLWRDRPVCTQGPDGSQVRFPEPAKVGPALDALAGWLQCTDVPVFFKATVAYCAICNLHPFMDGNGRVARWLYLAILGQAGLPTVEFLPLHEYFIRSRGSFAIYLRLAELRADWDSLSGYLARIVLEMSRWQSQTW